MAVSLIFGGEWTLIATTLPIALALDVAAGLVTGLAFVVFGVTTVQSAPVTGGVNPPVAGGHRLVALDGAKKKRLQNRDQGAER